MVAGMAMAAPRVLWVQAGSPLPTQASPGLSRNSHQSPEDALNMLKINAFDAIVLISPGSAGGCGRLVGQFRQQAPDTPLLISDPHATVPEAVRLVRSGVDGMLTGHEDDAAIIQDAIEQRNRRPAAGVQASPSAPGQPAEPLLVGASPEIQRVCQIIRLVGARRATVLITGETGTGKELAARALHQAGPRHHRPLVAVNCTALPENLLETELFGHVRGAFTGAVQTRIGRFEQAQGGTLMLDEIGELPLDLQTKLLRVLQERELQRLGSSENIRLDIRVVAATNCDLEQRVEEGRFREDLYYRLNVVPLAMPPLRQRAGDIPLLAAHFVAKVCQAEGVAVKTILPAALELLSRGAWPGNVRQLENAVETAVALSGDRAELGPADFLPAGPAPARRPDAPDRLLLAVPDTGLDYEQTLASIERSILDQALRKTGGNKKAAAAMLRLKRTTLSAKVRSLHAACR